MTDSTRTPSAEKSSFILKISIAVFASLLTFSETTVKSILNDWVSECKMIVEIGDSEPYIVSQEENEAIFDESPDEQDSKNSSKFINTIRLYVIGSKTYPATLQITSEKAIIDQVEFRHDDSQYNLSKHPKAGLSCSREGGSPLCSIKPQFNTATILLSELSSNYSYIFNVISVREKNDSSDHGTTITAGNTNDYIEDDLISVYSHPDKETTEVRCKVERAYWLNYYARQGIFFKVIGLTLLILILFTTLNVFKDRK